MNPVSTIIKVSEAQGSNEKIGILKTEDSPELRELLDRAFNPFRNYKIKNIEVEYSDTFYYNKTKHREFIQVLDMLEVVNANTKIRKDVKEFLESLPNPQRTIYTDVLKKNLRIGATAKTVNKAFGEIVVPSFDIMKADSYNPDMDLNRKIIIQDKLDGYRCIITKQGNQITAYSSNGNIIPLKTISERLMNIKGDVVLDGELVNSTRTSTSKVINALIKGNQTIDDITLIYYPFDIHPFDDYVSGNHTKTTKDRLIDLEMMVAPNKNVKPVKSVVVDRVEQVIGLYKQARLEGKEGIIVKDPEGLYEPKRSKNWIKLKGINSCTLKVVDVFEGTNKYKGMLGGVICQSSCGTLVTRVGSGFNDEDREVYWKTPPIGQYFEILFNEIQFTEDKKPFIFLPRFKEHRIDKEEADDYTKIIKEVM